MPNDNVYTTGKLEDRQVFKLFNEILEAVGPCDEVYQVGNVTVDPAEVKQTVGEGKSRIVTHAVLTGRGGRFTVQFRHDKTSPHQPGAPKTINYSLRDPSPYFDEVIVITGSAQHNQPLPSAEEILKLDQIISKYIKIKLPTGSSTEGVIDVLQREISELASFHKTMLEDAERQRRELDEAYRKKQAELDASIAKEREALRSEAETETAQITALREELEEKQKALDDRDHMHVRRELRENISKNIEERVSKALLPTNIGLMSGAIVLLTFAAAGVAAFIAYGSYEAFAQMMNSVALDEARGSNTEYSIWVVVGLAMRGIVASVVAIAFVVYALSWMRRTYLDNVRATHDLQRYALDINRASWTIETIMEMTTKEGRVLPDKWIEGACHGLFRNSGEDKAEISPLEAWSALLSVSGKLRHGPEGTTIEVDKKGARKLAKEVDLD